jgi:hypothetical protein
LRSRAAWDRADNEVVFTAIFRGGESAEGVQLDAIGELASQNNFPGPGASQKQNERPGDPERSMISKL